MLTPRQILERVASWIEQSLATPAIAGAWRESRHPYDLFPGPDSAEIEHHGFAISLVSTTPLEGDRQVPALGVLAITEFAVRFAHRLRADAVAVDLREAYDAETALVAAVKSTGPNPVLHIHLLSVARSTARSGTVFVGECRFQVGHRYPLE